MEGNVRSMFRSEAEQNDNNLAKNQDIVDIVFDDFTPIKGINLNEIQ